MRVDLKDGKLPVEQTGLAARRPTFEQLMGIVCSEIDAIYQKIGKSRLSREDWNALLAIAKINAISGAADRALQANAAMDGDDSGSIRTLRELLAAAKAGDSDE